MNISNTVVETLQKYGAQLVAEFGEIHPYLAAGATLVIGILLLYFNFKSKKETLEKQNKDSGESIAAQVPKDQETVGSVQDKLDDFLK